jgi:hypothetical protein
MVKVKFTLLLYHLAIIQKHLLEKKEKEPENDRCPAKKRRKAT